MKLYVWNMPYHVDWGGSIAYAVAESVEQAREIIMSSIAYEYGEHEEPPRGRPDVTGEPTRIRDLPCAEIYEWSE